MKVTSPKNYVIPARLAKPFRQAGYLVACWLSASLFAVAQISPSAPIGEQGHTTLPAVQPVSAPTLGVNSNPAQISETPALNTPALNLPAPNLIVSSFAIQQPTGLVQPRQAPVASVLTEQQERLNQALNEGYQALGRLDYPAAIAGFQKATELEPKNGKIWFELAYAFGYNNQLNEAVLAIQRVIQLEATNVNARSQLGYLLVKQDRIREAIEAFLAAELLNPLSYSLKLQLGYLYDRVNDKEKARVKFIQASRAPDLDIHQKAVDALKALAPVVFARRWIWANELYAAPTYYQRFNNLIAPFIFRSGLILSDRIGLEGYFSARVTRDTRSSGGQQPQIFEDNYAITSVGLRARPFKNALTVYGEAGLAYNLMPNSLATVKVRTDFRLGTYYSRIWGKRTANDEVRFPFNPVGETYFDVSYYSRFRHNVIGYLQAREGLRVLQARQTSLEAYGRFNLVKDSGHDFYNNIAETGVGLGFVPKQKWGIKLTAEYLRGFYFGSSRRGEPNPYASRYGDFRLALIFGKYLVKE